MCLPFSSASFAGIPVEGSVHWWALEFGSRWRPTSRAQQWTDSMSYQVLVSLLALTSDISFTFLTANRYVARQPVVTKSATSSIQAVLDFHIISPPKTGTTVVRGLQSGTYHAFKNNNQIWKKTWRVCPSFFCVALALSHLCSVHLPSIYTVHRCVSRSDGERFRWSHPIMPTHEEQGGMPHYQMLSEHPRLWGPPPPKKIHRRGT